MGPRSQEKKWETLQIRKEIWSEDLTVTILLHPARYFISYLSYVFYITIIILCSLKSMISEDKLRSYLNKIKS